MASVESSIDVNVDVSTAYDQWTQFETFPQFMEGIESVTQIDDEHVHWVAEIAGERQAWDAEITEQVPDQRIAWTATTGKPNGGIVTFQSLGESSCRINLRMTYEPEGLLENAGDALGLVDRRVKGDLGRFKRFVESRGESTGSWRGSIAV